MTQADDGAGTAVARSLAAHEALAQLARLPARKRKVLTLQVAGHSHAEIATALQMTPRTVKRQLLRARAGVRRADRAALTSAERS